MDKPRLRMGPKNESVRYRRPGLECELECYLEPEGRWWHVYAGGSSLANVNGEKRLLSPAEKAEVLPEIERYLSRVWWFGIFPKSYEVKFLG